MLSDREWKLKYTPEDGDLVKGFYIPALEDAERYDRLTGYFNAGALALAARGIEELVTLERHQTAIGTGGTVDPGAIEDDVLEDETADEVLDTEELATLEQRVLASEERQDIDAIGAA